MSTKTRFLLGFGSGCAIILLVAAVTGPMHGDWRTALLGFIAPLLIVPLCAAWVGVELVQARRPRRLFSQAADRPVASVALGVLTCVAGQILFVLALAWLGDRVPQMGLALICFATAAIVMCAPLPRVRAGRCVVCNYDLGGIVGAARCPECGTSCLGETPHDTAGAVPCPPCPTRSTTRC